MRVVFTREVEAGSITVSPRPVWKCRSCPMYGKRPSCPPHAPPWNEAREWVGSYRKALLLKFEVDYSRFEEEKREVLNHLLELETELFRKGKAYAFALFPGSCNLCSECSFERTGKCQLPEKVRPSIDAVGIELSSITEINFSESVLYGLVMIE